MPCLFIYRFILRPALWNRQIIDRRHAGKGIIITTLRKPETIAMKRDIACYFPEQSRTLTASGLTDFLLEVGSLLPISAECGFTLNRAFSLFQQSQKFLLRHSH